MRGLVTIVASMLFAGAASAQDYPDLKGTWAGTAEVVSARPDASSVLGDGAPEVKFAEVPVEVVIDRQEGRRFTGTVSGKGWSKLFIGVFATDETILWAEHDGTAQARLVGGDTLDYCYLEADDLRQMAACAQLKRK